MAEQKKEKEKPKNKPLKRSNGQGTVYKKSGRRRKPWVAEITKGYEIVEEELTGIDIIERSENSISFATDKKSFMKLKPKTEVKVRLDNSFFEGYISSIIVEDKKQCYIRVVIDNNTFAFSTVQTVDIIIGKSKRISEIIGTFEDKIKAKDALDLYRLVPTEPVEQKSTMTLKQVYEAWSKNKFKENLSKSTKDGIKASWKKLSKFEDRIFCEIRSDEFQDIIDECRDVEKVSKSALTKLKSLIFVLCEYAYHNGIIPTNYSSLLKIGKVETIEREAFTDEEIEIFKKSVNTVLWADTILVLCYTGMRPVEMLTLTNSNVNMEDRIITGGVKTDAGKNRIVPIHPLIYSIFEKWCNKNGETIFCNEKGKPLSVRAYREKRFAPALAAMGVRPLDPYSCRHTFATMMNRVNAPSANIQKLIGHVVGSDTTEKVYTHPEIEDLRKTIEMLS